MLGTSDAWSRSHSSRQTSEPAYYIATRLGQIVHQRTVPTYRYYLNGLKGNLWKVMNLFQVCSDFSTKLNFDKWEKVRQNEKEKLTLCLPMHRKKMTNYVLNRASCRFLHPNCLFQLKFSLFKCIIIVAII